jgi:hypothetical protein
LPKRSELKHSNLATLAGCQTFCVPLWWTGGRLVLIVLPFIFMNLNLVRGADTALSDTNLIPADIKLWSESMLWDEDISVSSGVGYNNNVLLSAFNPHGSAFVVNGLDLMVMRLPLDGWQIVGAVVGDDTRFWHDVGTSREDSFLGSINVQRELPDDWQVGWEERGLYEDEVLDVSTSSGVPATALVQGYGITGQPSLLHKFTWGLWVKLGVPFTRWLYQAPLDNYWEFGPVITAGYNLGKRGDITLSYGVSDQIHDQWVALDSVGQSESQNLQIWQHQVELDWHQYWDSRRHWRSATRLIFSDDEDNGGGWFNYYQYQVIQELSWQTDNWEIKGSAQLTYEDYPVQTIAPHTTQTLYRNFLDLSLEMERRLFKGLKVFGKAEYQRAVSNESLGAGDYNQTTVSGGLRYEF